MASACECAPPASPGCDGGCEAPVDACVATTCAQAKKSCGAIPNGCGGVLDCGACAAPLECGLRAANVCACPNGATTQGTETSCSDGVDNDCDGAEDCADPDCLSRVCDDGDACSLGDVCGGDGGCAGTAQVSCDSPPSACLLPPGTCDPSSGSCAYPPKPAGAPCDDRQACTTSDACDGMGTCAGNSGCNAPPGECFANPGTCSSTGAGCTYPAVTDGRVCGGGGMPLCLGLSTQCPSCGPGGACQVDLARYDANCVPRCAEVQRICGGAWSCKRSNEDCAATAGASDCPVGQRCCR